MERSYANEASSPLKLKSSLTTDGSETLKFYSEGCMETYCQKTSSRGGSHEELLSWAGCHLNWKADNVFRTDERFELGNYTRLKPEVSRIVPVVRGTLKRRREESILTRLV